MCKEQQHRGLERGKQKAHAMEYRPAPLLMRRRVSRCQGGHPQPAQQPRQSACGLRLHQAWASPAAAPAASAAARRWGGWRESRCMAGRRQRYVCVCACQGRRARRQAGWAWWRRGRIRPFGAVARGLPGAATRPPHALLHQVRRRLGALFGHAGRAQLAALRPLTSDDLPQHLRAGGGVVGGGEATGGASSDWGRVQG